MPTGSWHHCIQQFIWFSSQLHWWWTRTSLLRSGVPELSSVVMVNGSRKVRARLNASPRLSEEGAAVILGSGPHSISCSPVSFIWSKVFCPAKLFALSATKVFFCQSIFPLSRSSCVQLAPLWAPGKSSECVWDRSGKNSVEKKTNNKCRG